MYDCTQILQEFVLARYSQHFHKRLHMQFVLTFAVQVMSKDWLYDQLQWGVTKRVLFNKDPSLHCCIKCPQNLQVKTLLQTTLVISSNLTEKKVCTL